MDLRSGRDVRFTVRMVSVHSAHRLVFDGFLSLHQATVTSTFSLRPTALSAFCTWLTWERWSGLVNLRTAD